MTIRTIEDIARLIEGDEWRMNVLRVVADLDLPDWAIGAGFVRAAVWDSLTGKTDRTALADIDVIYFDAADSSPDRDRNLEGTLKEAMSQETWEVKNQARMHIKNNEEPYSDTFHALSRWLEVPTCIAARLNNGHAVEIIAPHGIEDLVSLRVRPTPAGLRNLKDYRARMARKNWPASWPGLIVEGMNDDNNP